MKKLKGLFFQTFIVMRVLASLQVSAWVEPGYYYGHRCEVTFKIISDELQSSIQIFNLFNINNAFFLPKTNSNNRIFTKSSDNRQMSMAYASNCIFSSYQDYYCVFINTQYNPASMIFQIPINSSFSEYIFRVQQMLCPNSVEDLMIVRLQMPIHSDYNNYYAPSYGSSQKNNTNATLSYAYDLNITINTFNLTYMEVSSVVFLEYQNFLIGCLFQYQISFTFLNISHYQSWDQIDIIISNIGILSIKGACSTDLILSSQCVQTTTGFKLVNLNKTKVTKSFQINQAEYFLNLPFVFSIYFNMSFQSQGSTAIIARIWANQTVLQTSYKVNFTGQSEYGYFNNTIYGLSQTNYNSVVGQKLPATQCIQAQQATTPLITANLVIFIVLVVLIVLVFIFRKQVFLLQKFAYLILIFIGTLIRLVYLGLDLQFDSKGLSNQFYNNFVDTSSLQDFIIKNIYEFQFLLSFIFSLIYIMLLFTSSEMISKVKWMYGKKNQCDLSTLVFIFIFFVLILINYKFYSIMLFKLHLNTLYWKKFKKYRLKNQVIYIIHFLHLSIDFILQAIVIICLSLMFDTNTANWYSYLIIIVQCLEIYFLIVVIKCFYIMARNSNLINTWQFYKLKSLVQKKEKEINGQQIQETIDVDLNRLQQQMRRQMEWSESFNRSEDKNQNKQKQLFSTNKQI